MNFGGSWRSDFWIFPKNFSIDLLHRSWNGSYCYFFWIGEVANLSTKYLPFRSALTKEKMYWIFSSKSEHTCTICTCILYIFQGKVNLKLQVGFRYLLKSFFYDKKFENAMTKTYAKYYLTIQVIFSITKIIFKQK